MKLYGLSIRGKNNFNLWKIFGINRKNEDSIFMILYKVIEIVSCKGK
jgi:hypothetical protein